ncbi:MAG: DNA primase [Caldilineaceae bacterium]|nr:DNA primase [Caldilineaceae bacterium]
MTAIEEIKQRIDIVEFISRYTPLQRAGSRYKGLCPFHNERTPSFIVSPDRGSWHCFGACSTGGDIFEFLMRKENMSFRDALETLARETGVELDDHNGDPERRRRAGLYAINEDAAAYFQDILRHHAQAAPARAYLERRQIDAATAERFAIGYALDKWDGLRNHLLHLGHSLPDLIAAGVIKENAEQTSTYDVFRGRVIIPIRDRRGRIVGFGGRVLDDSVPKYLNTPDTALFHKTKTIYAIDLAQDAIRRADQVVIVEGYMDVIAAHQYGFENVVACMGTALTSDQLQQLNRYTDNFVLALDADAAGQQATLRGLNQAREALQRQARLRPTAQGLAFEQRLAANLQIVSMPEGTDPDDVIRRDPAAWRDLVAGAQPLVEFFFKIAADRFDLTSGPGKGAAVSSLAPLIAELGDDVEREHYTRQLSKLVNISLERIEERVQAAVRTESVRHRRRPAPDELSPAPPRDAAVMPPPRGAEQGGFTQEDHLLALLLSSPELLIWLVQACGRMEIQPIQVDDFQRLENREIYRTLRQYLVGDEGWDSTLFQDELADPLHGRFGLMLAYGAQHPSRDATAVQEDAVKRLLSVRLNRLKEQSREINEMQRDLQEAHETAAAKDVGQANHEITRERWHLERLVKHLNELLYEQNRHNAGVRIQ